MTRNRFYLFAAFALCGCAAVAASQESIVKKTTVGAIQNARPGMTEVSLNSGEVKPSKTGFAADSVFAKLTDDTVFLQIEGRDCLKWKDLRERAEIVSAGQQFQFGGSQQEIAGVRTAMKARQVSRVLQEYLRTAAVAVDAEKRGLAASEAEIAAAREADLKYLARNGRPSSSRMRGMIDSRNPFYEQNLTNTVLQNAYIRKVLVPEVPISKEEIELARRKRHFYNETYKATNAFYRAQLQRVRADLLAKKITWDDASLEYSEAPDGVWGTFEPDELPPEVAKAVERLQMDDLSEVVDMTNSVQIVKMLKRNYAEDEAGKPNSKKLESYELSHIYIEKLDGLPELSDEGARDMILALKMRKALKKRQTELLTALMPSIKCVIPLVQDSRKNTKIKARAAKAGDKKESESAVAEAEEGDPRSGRPRGTGFPAWIVVALLAVFVGGALVISKSKSKKGER